MTAGTAHHSACQPPTPRSNSGGRAVRTRAAAPRHTSAAARARIGSIGFCFPAMLDELPGLVRTSPRCDNSTRSPAILAMSPARAATTATGSATGDRSPCHGDGGSASPSASARRAATSAPRPPNMWRVPTAPPSWMGRLSRWRRNKSAMPSNRRHPVGDPQTEGGDPGRLEKGARQRRSVSVGTCQPGQIGDQGIEIADQHIDRLPDLEHGGGVDHVLSGRSSMERLAGLGRRVAPSSGRAAGSPASPLPSRRGRPRWRQR